MSERTRDLRIESFRPILPPLIRLEEQPLGDRGSETVTRARQEIGRILRGEDDRLFVIVGPCSIHDPAAALDYAGRLKAVRDEHERDLCIVMRVYFEKPRTTVGWKGLINDPRLDGSFAINDGLRRARRLLLDLAELGLPAGCGLLDPISPQVSLDPVPGRDIAEQVAHGEAAIFGVMMESFLVDGRQELADPAALRYGQSITDACMGWEMTVPVLTELARAVRSRRSTS